MDVIVRKQDQAQAEGSLSSEAGSGLSRGVASLEMLCAELHNQPYLPKDRSKCKTVPAESRHVLPPNDRHRWLG